MNEQNKIQIIYKDTDLRHGIKALLSFAIRLHKDDH